MTRPDHLIIAAGTLAFIANFKEAGGFPENGPATIAGTAALATILAFAKDSAAAKPVVAFAALTLLVSVFVYVPKLVEKEK